MRDAEAQVGSVQQQLDTLQQSARDPTHLFGGRAAAQLRHALQQPQHAARFEQPPIGPVGCHIKIKPTHERLRTAVDALLGGVLDRWLVGSMRDADTLRALARSLGMDVGRMSVAVAKLGCEPYTLPPDTWPQDVAAFPLALDALEFEGDERTRAAVFNHVVDRSAAGSTVMVADEETARSVVYGHTLGWFESAEQHCISCFSAMTQQGKLFSAGATVVVASKVQGNGRGPRLVRSVAAEVERLQQQLAEHRAQLQAKRQAVEAADAEVAAANEAQHSRQYARQAAHQRKLKAEQAFQAACAQVEAQGEGTDLASQLASQLAGITRDLGDLQAQQTAALKRLQECEDAVKAATAALEADRGTHEVQRSTYTEKTAQLEELASKKAPDLRDKIARRQKLYQQAERELQGLQAELQQREAHLQETLDTLTQECSLEEGEQRVAQVRQRVRERVQAHLQSHRRARQRQQLQSEEGSGAGQPATQQEPSAEELAQLEALVEEHMSIDKLTARMQQQFKQHADAERQAGGGLADVRLELARLQERFDKRRALVVNTQSNVQALVKGLNTRHQAYLEHFKDTEKFVRSQFHKLLARRNHLGRLIIDADKEELSIEVKVNGVTHQGSPWQRDLKQLSGGERSLVTVAFLLAVGSRAQSPFRCMDEFDVFMDAINRRVATETLLENAYDSQSQYIFLTPQDVGGVLKAKEQLEGRRKLTLDDAFLRIQVLRKPRDADAGAARR